MDSCCLNNDNVNKTESCCLQNNNFDKTESCCSKNNTFNKIDSCCSNEDSCSTNLHVVIIGGGSAAFAAAIKANSLKCKITMINYHLPIGGCCLNVGCVPSKTLIRTAEAYYKPMHHNFEGIKGKSEIKSFHKIIEQKNKLIDQLRNEKYIIPFEKLKNARYIEGMATLISKNEVKVNNEIITADRIIIATGSSPFIPSINGLKDCKYYTNETIFEIQELPKSIIILGGGYIALECAQMFSRLGSKVTILQRSSRVLSKEDPLISETITKYLQEEGIQIVTNVTFHNIKQNKEEIIVTTNINEKIEIFTSKILLVATGHKGNTFNLSGIVELTSEGFLKVNDNLQTNIPTIYGAGDVIGEPLFVYTAAYEGSLAAENAILGFNKKRDYSSLPWVIFTDPQIAGVGLNSLQCDLKKIDYDISLLPLSSIPRCVTAFDTRGFIQLIREKKSDKLLGARIIAPEGSELLMELSLSIKFGLTTSEIASFLHPYLTLSEGIKLAAIGFHTDISNLSCCASNL